VLLRGKGPTVSWMTPSCLLGMHPLATTDDNAAASGVAQDVGSCVVRSERQGCHLQTKGSIRCR
jgi:hypothetical protein